MSGSRTRVRLVDGEAEVSTGELRWRVGQWDRCGLDAVCPMQLVVGALGACIALTLSAVASHKGIDLDDLDAGVDYAVDEQGRTRFRVDLRLGNSLTDRERKILFNSARLCDVGKMLKGEVAIDYQFQDGIGER